MRLRLYDVNFNDEIKFNVETPIRICCESKSYFSKLIKSLKGHIEPVVSIIDENGNIVSQNDLLVLIDYYSISSEIKSVLPKIYKLLSKHYVNDEEVNSKLKELENVLKDIVDVTTLDINISFDYLTKFDLNEIYKFVSLKPICDVGDYFNDLINFIYCVQCLSLSMVFVFVNISSYFQNAEICEILKICKYCNINLIMIDDCISQKKYCNEKLLNIDSDYFDILI